MDCFDCIFYGILYCRFKERLSLSGTNDFTVFMIFLFLAAPAPRVQKESNLMGTPVRNGLRFFPLLGKKALFCAEVKFSY